jgi:hypothetical protein
MGTSLFEQLKKTGLVDDKKAKQAKHSQYKKKKQKTKKDAATQLDEATLLAQKVQAEKIERDRQLNQAKKVTAEHKAVAAQIKQLIETNRVDDDSGDVVYNFTDDKVIKHLYVSEQTHKHLVAGHLAIAKLENVYALVPLAVAEKIKQRDEQCIIFCEPPPDAESTENDPYADYQIPDDLMW